MSQKNLTYPSLARVRSRGVSWGLVGFCEISSGLVWFHGSPWGLVGFFGIPWGLVGLLDQWRSKIDCDNPMTEVYYYAILECVICMAVSIFHSLRKWENSRTALWNTVPFSNSVWIWSICLGTCLRSLIMFWKSSRVSVFSLPEFFSKDRGRLLWIPPM